jgi:hypothetical protein
VGSFAGGDRAEVPQKYPKAGNGRRPYALETMLRIHLMQNWFGYSDPAMEEALYEVAPLRRFAGLSLAHGSVSDETTILNFRRLLENNDLAPAILATINAHLGGKGLLLRQGTVVDVTIIHAPSSTKNKEKARDPEMHQTKKGKSMVFRYEGGDLVCLVEFVDGSTDLAKHRTRVPMSERITRTALQMTPKAPLPTMSGAVSTAFEHEISADPSSGSNA